MGTHLSLLSQGNVYAIGVYSGRGDKVMATARVFKSGNSQAVRLPKQFRVKSKELEIYKRGDEIVLREKAGSMARAFDLIAALPEEILTIRDKQDKPRKRKCL